MKTITKLIYVAFAAVTLATGAVTAHGALNDLFASVNGNTQDGGGFVYQYTPTGVQGIFASGLSRPRGVAFDRDGNLFVATNVFINYPTPIIIEATIFKITPSGVQTTFFNLTSSFFFEGLTTDRSGNVFVMAQDNDSPTGASTIFKFTPDGIQSTFGSVPGQAWALAFDSAGNLFASDGLDQTIYEFTPDGTRSIFVGPEAFGPDAGPVGLAFNRFGNLFVSAGPFAQGQDLILEFEPDGTGSPFATGLSFPRGLAFDRAGNLFVAVIDPNAPGQILKFTPDGNGTVFASAIGSTANGGPEFLAVQVLPVPRPLPRPPPRPRPR